MYMTRNKGGVAEVTGRFVEAARREPFRLWEVQSVAGRESATLQCLTTRETVTVFDSALSVAANPWDIICGHIVGWDGVYVGSAVLPYALPAIYRPAIIKRLRKVKASSGAELLPLQNKVLNAYGQTLREMIDRAPPELRNTDNEELVWIRSRYRFAPKDQAALLQTLAGDQAMDAEPDESPDPGGVWHYSWGRDGTALGRTLLGQIRVGPDFLEFECNSRERREELVRRVVAKHAKALTLESSDATPMDRAMLEEQARSLANSPAPEARDLSGEPEVAKVIDSIHMRWVDGTVPALGGITPREAVKTAQGRQRVIDLLHEFENMDARARQSAYRFDYNRIRRELGLDEE
jgi:hypothetical protein